jgi:lysozyme
VWTIGYGHTRNVTEHTRQLTQAQAEAYLLGDMYDCHMELKRRLGDTFTNLDEVRQGVLINMAFNLGVPGLLKFRATLDHIRRMEWNEAAEHMLASLWAKQVKGRAVELAERMRTGLIQESHLVT